MRSSVRRMYVLDRNCCELRCIFSFPLPSTNSGRLFAIYALEKLQLCLLSHRESVGRYLVKFLDFYSQT